MAEEASPARALRLSPCSPAAPTAPRCPSSANLNPFAEKAVPLPGKRIPVMQTQNVDHRRACRRERAHRAAGAARQSGLGAARRRCPTTRRATSPSTAPRSEAWRADAGTGSGSAGRVTASPIVYADRIYTLDAEGNVSAFSTSGGSAVWRVSLKPERENASGGWFSLGGGSSGGGYGGGLAVDNGRLYAATGFGNVVALDPQSGKKLWEKQLEAPVRASPTAAGDRLFVVTLDGRFYCLAGADGGELWSARGLPQQASLINNASPAVDGDIVVVPYPSGDLVALHVADGSSAWSESLSRTRTTSELTSMSDAARPAIDRRHGVRRRPRRPHDRHASGDGRAAVVAQRARHPAAVGGRRQRLRRRYQRAADGDLAPGRQDPVDGEAARAAAWSRADARRRHAVARLVEGRARRGRCRHGAHHDAEGSRHARSTSRPWSRRAACTS